MASRVIIFPALLLLLSMLATTSMGTPGQSCYTTGAYPSYEFPLAGCRAVVKSQCLGGPVTENARADCCRQLAAINNEWCKCAALSKMLDIMHKELGVAEGQQGQQQAEVFPGCRREVLHRATASIPAFCKQDVPSMTSSPPRRLLVGVLPTKLMSK